MHPSKENCKDNNIYGGPQVSRQNFLSHGKTFFYTAKLSFSRQNFLFHGKTLSHGKTFFYTAKLFFTAKLFLMAKLCFTWQNFLFTAKLFLTGKLSFSRQNFLSQGHTCLHRMTIPKQYVNSFLTHVAN